MFQGSSLEDFVRYTGGTIQFPFVSFCSEVHSNVWSGESNSSGYDDTKNPMAWNIFELSTGTGAKRAVALHGHGWCEESRGAVASGWALLGQRLLDEVEDRMTDCAAFACHAIS